MKKFMIFFAIIVLCIICLVIGGFLGVYITFDNGEKFCENLVQDTDNEQKAEDEDIVAYDKDGNVVMIKDFDKYFLSLGVKLEDNLSFIMSSNSTMLSSYTGAMYNDEISDEYKVVYTLNRIFYENENLYNLINETLDSDSSNITFELKYETINSLIGDIFVDSEIDKDFETTKDMYHEAILSVSCDDGLCNVEVQTGLGGVGVYSEYLTNLVSETYNEETGYTEYVVSTYYIETTSDENLYKLYDKKDGTLVKSVKVEAPYILEYDAFKEHFNDISQYKYSFDENGLLVSVEAM